MKETELLVALLVALLAALALGLLLYAPGRSLASLGLRFAGGGAALWGLNLAGAAIGFHLGLNPATALIVGILGLPGLALLIWLQLLLA